MTPEQEALILKAQDSIKAAELLRDNEMYNFSVSRAYYAMFYVVEALLIEEGLSFSKHSAVIARFGQIFAKTGRAPVEFHRYLIDAQDSRNQGDYDPLARLSKDDAELHITRAKEFLGLANRLLAPEDETG